MAEKRIGKHVYKFDEICGWDAFDLADLAVEILVPFADIIESMVKNDKASAPEGEAAFVRAFSLAIRNRNTPAIRQIMERLLADCRRQRLRGGGAVLPFFRRRRAQQSASAGGESLLTADEARRIAPNAAHRIMAWRPIMADPPLYSVADVRTLTLSEMLDANEILDLRNALSARAMERAQRKG